MRSPKLRLYVDELTECLRIEEQARWKFREELNDDVRAEFINGEVFVHSPARYLHTEVVGHIARVLSTYVLKHELGSISTEQALVEMTRNDYAPDICFWGREKLALLKPDTMLCPAPDLICEVLSPSTERHDRGVKFEDYAAHGVGEYWLVDADQRLIEQYHLQDGRYEKGEVVREGFITSRVVRGFRMPVAAAFDPKVNLEALQAILTSQKPD
ncbi:MAG: Uma2 family endonuclease [Planctomycetaceae bacterium]|nr:Uma2 family endonuclease [Planctomycetaceae bacterium]